MSRKNNARQNRYSVLVERIFFERYKEGVEEIRFNREDLTSAARDLDMKLPKNLGDILYTFKFRAAFPQRIIATQTTGKEWIVEGTGRSEYSFKLVRINRIVPNPQLIEIKVPDATPEIVSAYSLSDEQALLAKLRYNRLIDIFLGLAAYSLQNHLRTTVARIGQIEIDELYIGIDNNGCHYILPVQAKGGSDQLSTIQAKQDLTWCEYKYPALLCRPISAQFMAGNIIALFELTREGEEIRIVKEKHYRLVPADQIDSEDLRRYQTLT